MSMYELGIQVYSTLYSLQQIVDTYKLQVYNTLDSSGGTTGGGGGGRRGAYAPPKPPGGRHAMLT